MAITHVALTHFHPDHVSDLPILMQAWKYGRIPARTTPLAIVGPVGTRTLLERMAALYGPWMLDPGFPLEILELEAGTATALDDAVVLGSRKVPHTEESVAYSIEARGRRVVYSGDTGFDPALGSWAIGADVLLCECSLPARLAIPTHLTPEQCGELAALASPARLVLTHFYPPVLDDDVRAIVGARFGGPVTLADDGWHIDIEDA